MPKPILIVNDSPDESEFLQRFLRTQGVANRCFYVPDGLTAIDYLYGLEPFSNRVLYPFPKLVFLDINMPRKTGYEVLEWLNAHPEIPTPKIVIHSQAIGFKEMEQCYLLGANSFLLKQSMDEQFRDLLTRYPDIWQFAEPRSPSP